MHHDTHLIGADNAVIPLLFLVDSVDVVILESLMYFESLKVESVGVHFHESLPRAVITVRLICCVVGMHSSR